MGEVEEVQEQMKADMEVMKCFNGYTEGHIPMYRDSNHLTTVGAQLVFNALVPVLDGAAQRASAEPAATVH